jgi:8-oxo-dGTP pyrophosphatase MutT (NUDIX family)
MKMSQLFEGYYDDEDEDSAAERFHQNNMSHSDALEKTGFWGKEGAGVVFMAKSTGRLLLCHRSGAVEQPGTWGGWGGAIDAGETPVEGANREAEEETGHPGPFDIRPLYVFTSGTFRYSNFLIVVEDEFAPILNWESQGYEWCEWGQWPKPLHFGLTALFNDGPSVQTIKAAIQSARR